MWVIRYLFPTLLLIQSGRAQVWPTILDGLASIIGKDFEQAPDYTVKDGQTFDYIVVGAGGSGCAVAARLLLADTDSSVLLIEAGGDADLLSKIPANAMNLLGSNIDWQYSTISNNKSCLSSENKACRFSRGKVIGGSTAINYMMYTRGNRDDYNLNITGWTWDEMKQYFLRFEGLQDLDKLPETSIPYHNTSGPMKIGFSDDPNIVYHKDLIVGLQEFDFPYNLDMNAESQIGVSRIFTYIYKGERMSTAKAYLTINDVKKNIKIAKKTRCTGVIINENNEAQGVTVLQGDKKPTLSLYARKEVILSAGTIGTAQILMLSGVGPAQHLQSLDIAVKADLPVGQDMSDHILVLTFIQTKRKFLTATKNIAKLPKQAAEWVADREGPFASDGLTDVTALFNTRCYDHAYKKLVNNATECKYPTMQMINSFVERGVLTIGKSILKKSTGLTDDIVDDLVKANKKHALVVVSLVLLDPKSRGWIELESTDPLKNPKIYPNYLSDENDVDEIIRAVRLIEDLAETDVFSKHEAAIVHPELKGCPAYDVTNSDEYWRCYAKHVTFSSMHAVGTSSLGTVVDERLRVKGIKRLRVGDLSVLYRIPRGNTAAAAIAIGERLADFVLEDNKKC